MKSMLRHAFLAIVVIGSSALLSGCGDDDAAPPATGDWGSSAGPGTGAGADGGAATSSTSASSTGAGAAGAGGAGTGGGGEGGAAGSAGGAAGSGGSGGAGGVGGAGGSGGAGGGACPDADGDGYTASWCGGDDCDDTDPAVHPGVPEPDDW